VEEKRRLDVSGWMEVEVLSKGGDKVLVHSMRAGDGYPDTSEKLEKVLAGIRSVSA